MKVKASDYVADFLVKKGIEHVFTVVGGGAMHLNDSIGHHAKLRSTYCHHEQAAAMAAEAYARVHGGMAALCVTSGPGAINALNGVAGAYQDSIPLLVVSGQMKSSLTVRRSGLPLRTLGGQEFDIVSALDNMTKYAEMIEEPQELPAALENAYRVAKSGRPGPCWLDIPVDVQGSFIDTEALGGLDAATQEEEHRTDVAEAARHVLEKLKSAARPVLYAGNGIRLAGAASFLEPLARRLSVPVVTCWNSIDLIATENPHYCGRGGTMGDRAGNFAVQNSDLLLSIGSRLSIYQVGYDVRLWARAAHTVVNDIDPAELNKNVRADIPVLGDLRGTLPAFVAAVRDFGDDLTTHFRPWLGEVLSMERAHPLTWKSSEEIRPEALVSKVRDLFDEDTICVTDVGQHQMWAAQFFHAYAPRTFLTSGGLGTMGYGLPAALGAKLACPEKKVVLITGDGSIMMNCQEFATIADNDIDIKVVIVHNSILGMVGQWQRLFYTRHYSASELKGKTDYVKLAAAMGVAGVRIETKEQLAAELPQLLAADGARLIDVVVPEEADVVPMVPGGKRLDQMVLGGR